MSSTTEREGCRTPIGPSRPDRRTLQLSAFALRTRWHLLSPDEALHYETDPKGLRHALDVPAKKPTGRRLQTGET